MELTYRMAWQAGIDAGDRAMRAGGRTTWDRADHAAAAAVVERLLGYCDDSPRRTVRVMMMPVAAR